MFWYIDAYYLRLERALRNREQKYINLMNSLEDTGDNSTEEKGMLFLTFDHCLWTMKITMQN